MINFKCDLCGKETKLYPSGQPAIRKEKKEVKFTNPETGEEQVTEVTEKVPVYETVRVQDSTTGLVKEIERAKIKFDSPKTVVVRLAMGDEKVKRDFCEACYRRKVKTRLNRVFKFLAEIEPK